LVVIACGRTAGDNSQSSGDTAEIPSDTTDAIAAFETEPFQTQWIVTGVDLSLGRVARHETGAIYAIAYGLGPDAEVDGNLFAKRSRGVNYVIKRNADGSASWATPIDSSFSSANQIQLTELGIASDGTAYVGGWDQQLPADGGAEQQAVLVSIADNGAIRWTQHLGSHALIDGVASTTASGVAVTGVFDGTIDFGDGPKTSATPTRFMATFSADGTVRWAETFAKVAGSPQPIHLPTLVSAGSGGLFLAGSFSGTLDFGLGSMTAAHKLDRFVIAIGADGAVLWNRQISGRDDLVGPGDFVSLAVDGTDRIFISSSFVGTLSFGGVAVDSPTPDLFVTEFDAAGNPIAAMRTEIPIGDPYAMSLVTDKVGNCILSGTIRDAVVGGETATAASGSIYLARLRSDLSLDWAWRVTRPLPTPEHPFSSQAFLAQSLSGGDSIAISGDFTDELGIGGASIAIPGDASTGYGVFLGSLSIDR
jgi:hypothetical protein